ncbi:amino acid/polyamine transporter I [Yarrowia lipolytica]|nr:amino acid/polyamine transporter I [Yarrowia lipolytica]RDW54705.1 amino acid/polyamine transporter I [Yarrowia lipolytica]
MDDKIEEGYGQNPPSGDANVLATMGYKPELKRNYSMIQVFGIAFSIMGLFPSISSALVYSMPSGPAGMVWGWFVASFCIMMVGLSMAELGSSLPTSGGLYWWTYHFATPKLKRPLCFLVGYSNTLGLTAGIVSIDYGFAQLVLAVAGVATDGEYVATKYTVYGVFAACIISHAIVASLASDGMSKLQTGCIVLNIAIIIIAIIALPIGARHNLHDGAYIFGKLENLTTWPTGWTFFLGWLAPIWTIGSFDSCVHMAEEASNATKAVPFGIISSIGMCWVLGFVINIVLACVMAPDTERILSTPFQQPMAQLIYDCLGKKWTLALMVIIFVLQWTMGLSIVVAASRQSWAFARDGALPFSNFFKVVNHKVSIPVRAVWGNCTLGLVIGCLCMIDAAAAAALFSLAAASNDLAWMTPIACRLIWGYKNFVPGPFYLGCVISKCVSTFAVLYLCFAICLLMFPLEGPNPNKDNMNYTCVINVAVWAGSLIYYFGWAHKWFEGPQSNLELEGMEVEGVPQLTKMNQTDPAQSDKSVE